MQMHLTPEAEPFQNLFDVKQILTFCIGFVVFGVK